jgi:hypothetical protein
MGERTESGWASSNWGRDARVDLPSRFYRPRVLALPLAIVMAWSGVTLIVRSVRLRLCQTRQRREAEWNTVRSTAAGVKTSTERRP